MKKRNIFLLLSTILMGVFSLASLNNVKGVQAEVKDDSTMTAPVAFAESSETKTYYVELPQWWYKDSSGTNIHYWGDGFGSSWFGVSMTKISTTSYKYDLPINTTGLIFIRASADGTQMWGAQTIDIFLSEAGVNDKYTISPTEAWNNDGKKATGAWSVYVEEELPPLPAFTPTVEGITDSKVRIWLDRSADYDSGFTVTMKVEGTYYLPTSYVGAIHNGRWFAYYDMPKSVLTGKHVDLVVFVTDVKQEIVISVGTYVAGDNNKVWKIIKSGDSASLTKGKITERILPTFFAKVLEGYLTCSPSAENGYNAYPQIDDNFLPRDGEGYWNLEGNLDGNFITDYAGVGTSGYGSDRGTGVQVDAYAKYQKMEALYLASSGGSGAPSIFANNNSITIIILISIIGITSLAALYFLRKKKVA